MVADIAAWPAPNRPMIARRAARLTSSRRRPSTKLHTGKHHDDGAGVRISAIM
jgi:hypothetical protein